MQKMNDLEFLHKLKDKGILEKLMPVTWYKGNNRIKIKVLCLTCGNIYDVMPLHLLAGKGCPNCSKKKRWDFDALKYFLSEYYGNKYEIKSTNFSKKSDIVKLYDNENEKEVNLSVSSIIERHVPNIPDDIKNKVASFGNNYSCIWYDESDDCVTIKYKSNIYHCKKEDIFRYTYDTECDIKTKIFARKLEAARPGEFTVVGKYIGQKTLLDIKCNKCGKIFQAKPQKLLFAHKKCPHCSVKIPERLNQEKFVNKVKELTNDEYTVLGKYKNGKTPILIRHNTCENEFEMRPEDFLSGQRCPECAKKKRAKARLTYSTETFKEKVNELVGTEYSVISDYIGGNKYIILKHNICGHEYSVYPMNFIRGNRCPYCSHGHLLKTQEEFEKEVAEVDPEYEVVGKYTGCQNKVLLKHKTCGTVFEIYPNNFLYKGGRCKICSPKEKSRSEEELLEYVKSIYNGSVEENHREYSGKTFTEVDIYLKDLKLGIEFDGLYWHSVEQGKDENFHIGKTKKLAESGFKLIHIFEDEWINHKDAVKALLSSYIIKNNENLEIYNPKKHEINEFIKKYSLNNENKYDYCLGLKLTNKLVALFLFTIGKNRRVLVLRDIICLSNIVGNISDVMNKALTETKTDYVVADADCRLHPPIDNVFTENNFTVISVKKPKMWYTKNESTRSRKPFQVKCQFRVWDCGKTIYKYQKI